MEKKYVYELVEQNAIYFEEDLSTLIFEKEEDAKKEFQKRLAYIKEKYKDEEIFEDRDEGFSDEVLVEDYCESINHYAIWRYGRYREEHYTLNIYKKGVK